MAKRKQKGETLPAKKSADNPIDPIEGTDAEQQEELRRDVFDEFLFHAANYIYVKRKLFIGLAIAVLAVIFTGYGTFKFIEYRENQRNVALFDIEKLLYDTTLEEAELFKSALPKLSSYIEDHSGTDQAKVARFYKAGLLYKQKSYQEAEAELTDLLSIVGTETDLFVLTSIYLANVYRDQGNFTSALEVLQSSRVEGITDIVLMEEAEIYLQQEDSEKAKETLQLLIQENPNSVYLAKAKQMLELL